MSRDSVVVHEEYGRLAPGHGGVHGLGFPLLGDMGGHIARSVLLFPTDYHHFIFNCEYFGNLLYIIDV